MPKPPDIRAVAWIVVLLAAAALPAVLLLAQSQRYTAPAWAFAMALGYAGIAFVGLQFLLTARLRWVVRPLGLETLNHVHRYLAIAAFGLVTLHGAVVAWRQPALVGFHGMPSAHVVAGIAAWATYGLLIATSLYGRRLGLSYRAWRALHAGGSALAFGGGCWHAWASGRYVATPEQRAVFAGAVVAWLLLLAWVRIVRPALLSRRGGRTATDAA